MNFNHFLERDLIWISYSVWLGLFLCLCEYKIVYFDFWCDKILIYVNYICRRKQLFSIYTWGETHLCLLKLGFFARLRMTTWYVIIKAAYQENVLFCICEWFFLVWLRYHVIHAGSGVRNEFSYCWWYECYTRCQTKKKIGVWNVGKTAHYRNACWREGMTLKFWFYSDISVE